MKTLSKMLGCAAMLISLSSFASAQLGWSVTDRNQDTSSLTQLVYRFDVNTGAAELIQTFPSNAEQEGLFSTGGASLFGYSEFDANLPTADSSIPGTRLIPHPGATRAPNLTDSNGRAQRVCAFPENAVGTETGAGYDPTSGFVFVVNSNDNPADGAVGTQFSRFKPNCGSYQLLGSTIGGSGTYVDGVAVDALGQVYMSDLRLQDQVYRFIPPTTLASCNVFNLGLISRDSGLAFDFENNRLLALAEDGRIFQVGTPGAPCTGGFTQLGTITAGGTVPQGDFEGFDIPLNDPID